MNKIENSNYFWWVEEEEIHFREKKKLAPFILVALVIGVNIFLYSSMDLDGEPNRFLIYTALALSPWVYFWFRSASYFSISKNSICIIRPFWKKRIYEGKLKAVNLESKRVGGRLPHEEVKVFAELTHGTKVMLFASKKYGVDARSFGSFVDAVDSMIDKEL